MFAIMVDMEIDQLQRAQLIIDQFRAHVHELQERLIAEQVAHRITKAELLECTSGKEPVE